MKSFFCRALAIALIAQFGFTTTILAAADDDAQGKVIEKPVIANAADTPEKFAIVQKQIQEQMTTGGRYEYIKPADKGKAQADMDEMAAMLGKAGSVAAMSQDEKVKLFNAQENLNGILTHSDGNRLVCENRAPIGSNLPVKTCRTAASIEKSRRDAQKYLQDTQKTPQTLHGS